MVVVGGLGNKSIIGIVVATAIAAAEFNILYVGRRGSSSQQN